DDKQVKKVGKKQASWYVGWLDPEGKRRCKSFGRGSDGKRLADHFKRKVEAELMTGTYQSTNRKTWADFRAEYETKVLAGMAAKPRSAAVCSLNHFERIVKPVKMTGISANVVVSFVAVRRLEPGLKKGDTCSPATVNHDLRHIKAALNMAEEWGFLTAVPKV